MGGRRGGGRPREGGRGLVARVYTALKITLADQRPLREAAQCVGRGKGVEE